MNKFIAITALIVVAASFNVGCTASAGIKKADAAKASTATQIAYVSAPQK